MTSLRLPAPIRIARLFGIPVLLDWSWLLMIPLYSWAIARGYLPREAPGLPQAEYWALGLLTTFLLVVSVLTHELAHALVARTEGVEIDDIIVYMFGGVARMSSEPKTPAGELKIAVVGPGASFALGVLFFVLDAALLTGTSNVGLSRVFRHMGGVNLILAIFNLLPGLPLDGGHVLRALLWRSRGNRATATLAARRMGRFIGYTLLVVGVYTIVGNWAMGVWINWPTALFVMSIGLMLILLLGPVERPVTSTVAEAMRRPALTIEPTVTVHELVNDILPTHRQTSFLVAREGRLHGVLSLADIRHLPREAWTVARVAEHMQPVDPTLFVSPAARLADAAHQIGTNGIGQAAVVDDAGLVVGSLSIEDVRGVPQ